MKKTQQEQTPPKDKMPQEERAPRKEKTMKQEKAPRKEKTPKQEKAPRKEQTPPKEKAVPREHQERYSRQKEVSASSRYSKSETFRTGSRYADKARPATEAEKKRARRAAAQTARAAKAAGASAFLQAQKETRKVEEAKQAGGLTEPESRGQSGELSQNPSLLQQESAQNESARKGSAQGGAGLLAGRSWQGVLLMVLAAVLVISYIVTAVFFSRRFYPGTTIFGINATAKGVAWTKAQVEEKIGEYTLSIQEREGRTETITAEQIGLHYDDQGAIERRMKRQYSLLWPVMMLRRKETETPITTTYQRSSIDDTLQQLACVQPENQQPPENAYVGESQEGYVIVPQVEGTTLRFDVFRQAVVTALDEARTELSLEEQACYTNPSVLSDDAMLLADVNARNDLLGADITLDFASRSEHIDTPQVMKFVVRDEDGSYRFSPEAVWAYTASLAEKYDTYGGTRTFQTSIGTEEILYGGDYGWAIDQNETAQTILDDVRAKKVETMEPIYAFTAMSREENDIGDTYVEVCISRQEMWCYKDGVLVTDTPVVTGNPNLGNATPAGGVWAIDGKMQNFVLVGEGYRAPVDYWMPFNGNVGIHDLQTRYWFGSTIYLSNGSHGCVNTPLDAVSRIYDAVSVGTPVIVYEGEGTTDYGASAWR